MFDKDIYKEAFSSLHASNKTLSEVMKIAYENKKTFRAKRLRIIPVCAAIMALLVCTGFAIYYAHTALTYFGGDTTLIEPAVQVVDETSEQGEYRLAVDSVLSDAHNTVIGFSLEALTDEAVATLNDKRFTPTNVLRFKADSTDVGAVFVTYSATIPEADSLRRRFSVRLEGVGAPNTLRLYWADNTDDEAIVLTLDKQIESLTVTAEPIFDNDDYFIRSCVLSATGVEFEVEFTEAMRGNKIIEAYFRMADGSLKTLSQLYGVPAKMNFQHTKDVSENIYRYTKTFRTLIDPLSVKGVIMNGMEYSFFHPEYVEPIEIPESVRPFLTPFVEVNDKFYFLAYDVCEHIGASLEKGEDQYTIYYYDKTFIFSPEDASVKLNGEIQQLDFPATFKDGKLILPGEVFAMLGLTKSMYYPESGPVQAPENWLVAP